MVSHDRAEATARDLRGDDAARDDAAHDGVAAAPATRAGTLVVRADLAATVLFTLTSVLAAAAPDAFVVVSVPVALALFAAGCAAFAWAYAVAVARSRHELVSLPGLFFLGAGVAPGPVRRALRASLAVQVVVAVGAALVRPFTPLAFGVLVPTLGLGLMALWAARHGRFTARAADG